MRSIPLVFLLFISLAVWEFGPNKSVALSCDSCGSECARACGTRHFRTCCFNYVRKRSSNLHPYPLNRANYEILYGTYFDNDFRRKLFNENMELTTRNSILENSQLVENEVSNHQNFYKPWKEMRLNDNELFFDYEQQNRQGSEQKHPQPQQQQQQQQHHSQPQQYVYDA